MVGVMAIAGASQQSPPAGVATIPKANYHVVHGWPELPDGTVLDEVSAVAVDSHGNVLVLQRGGRQWPDSDVLDLTPIAVPTIFVFDGRSGRLIRKWGDARFALPHSVTVDRQDNLWVTDVAWHLVFKFSPDGTLVLTLGERGVAKDDG